MYNQPKMPHRNMSDLPASERGAQLWLTVDEVLEILPVSRSWLWRGVRDKTFPAPYKWKGGSYWTQGDIRGYISLCAKGEHAEKEEKTPVTWESVENLLRGKSVSMTNKQIAHNLNCDETDTSLLTRLMAKAGTLVLFKPMGSSAGSPNFYVINDSKH